MLKLLPLLFILGCTVPASDSTSESETDSTAPTPNPTHSFSSNPCQTRSYMAVTVNGKTSLVVVPTLCVNDPIDRGDPESKFNPQQMYDRVSQPAP